jgi:hypothetical protein
MELTNFGAILSYADTIEQQDGAFYEWAAAHGSAALADFCRKSVAEAKKFRSTVQRVKREQVTEMILEFIDDFESSGYDFAHNHEIDHDEGVLREHLAAMEGRAVNYYTDAAAKLTGLPEVARELKRLATRHEKRRAALARLAP